MPALSAPVDALRAGAVSFKHTSLQPHPVEAIQGSALEREWELSLAATAKAFGAAAAIERRVDRAALAAIERLPGGPPSSGALLESYMGRDSNIGFEDSLGRASRGARGAALASLSAVTHAPFPLPQSPTSSRGCPRRACTSCSSPDDADGGARGVRARACARRGGALCAVGSARPALLLSIH